MDREQVGANLRAARRHLGLTQAAAAERLGVTAGALAGYESGRRYPGPLLPRLADLYGASVDRLLGRPDSGTPNSAPDPGACPAPAAPGSLAEALAAIRSLAMTTQLQAQALASATAAAEQVARAMAALANKGARDA